MNKKWKMKVKFKNNNIKRTSSCNLSESIYICMCSIRSKVRMFQHKQLDWYTVLPPSIRFYSSYSGSTKLNAPRIYTRTSITWLLPVGYDWLLKKFNEKADVFWWDRLRGEGVCISHAFYRNHWKEKKTIETTWRKR